MASLYNASVQRDAALLVFQRPNNELSGNQKLALDNAWTTGTPGGAAGYAQSEIERYANFLYAEGLDSMPPDWTRWLVYEIGAALAPQWNPSVAANIRELRDEYKQAALTTFTRIASNYVDDSDEQNEKTWLGIRRSVMANCLHQPRPVFAAPELVDGAIRASLHKVWNESEWSWQIISDKSFTITNADGDVQTINVTPDIRSIRSMRLWYDSSVASERKFLKYISADEMQRELAAQNDDGQPEYFRLQRSGRELQIVLDRTPDKTYTIRGEFARRLPDLGSYESIGYGIGNEDFNDALALIPDEFLDIIEKLALGRVLLNRGRSEGRVISDDAQRELESLVEMDLRGEPLQEDSRNTTRLMVHEQIVQGGGGAAGGSL